MTRRVIVADTSVLVAAFFSEPTSRQAKRLLDAIERQSVTAFAPFGLIAEFLCASEAKCSRRGGGGSVTREHADLQVELFFEVAERSLVFLSEADLKRDAWSLMHEFSVSPPDSWMLATARALPKAELWVSHSHADGFVSMAGRHHPRVFTLVENASRLP